MSGHKLTQTPVELLTENITKIDLTQVRHCSWHEPHHQIVS